MALALASTCHRGGLFFTEQSKNQPSSIGASIHRTLSFLSKYLGK